MPEPLRVTLPKVFAAGAENTDVSNQSLPLPMSPMMLESPVRFGRCVLPGARSSAPLAMDVERACRSAP